jgi:alpha-L-arabinofuranosidase
MRLTVRESGQRAGVANGGFWGMNIVAGAWYDLTFHARTEGAERFDLGVSLESANGRERHAAAVVRDVGGGWKEYRVSLRPKAATAADGLAFTVNRPGTIWFDVVSLFPRDTFKAGPTACGPTSCRRWPISSPRLLDFPAERSSAG